MRQNDGEEEKIGNKIYLINLLPYFEKEFREDALVRSVHYGTHIEGNELNLSEAEKVLMGQSIAARDRDIQEVINYRKVMELIGKLETKSSRIEIDEEKIKEIQMQLKEYADKTNRAEASVKDIAVKAIENSTKIRMFSKSEKDEN